MTAPRVPAVVVIPLVRILIDLTVSPYVVYEIEVEEDAVMEVEESEVVEDVIEDPESSDDEESVNVDDDNNHKVTEDSD